MAKSREAFRTISEVSDWLETPAHVLRFWESRFSQVKPVKRAGGRRYYRPADMRLLGGIKQLLHDDGLTIKGVQKILREQGVKHVSALCVEQLSDDAAAPSDKSETQTAKATDGTNADWDAEARDPVRWIDPLEDEPQETVKNQEPTETSENDLPRRFGFVPDSISRKSVDEDAPAVAPAKPADPADEQPADVRIRQEVARAESGLGSEPPNSVDEIDSQTSDERIVALYARLRTLRDRVKTEMLAG